MQKGVEEEATGCEEEADAKGIFKSRLIGSRYNLRLTGWSKKTKAVEWEFPFDCFCFFFDHPV